MRKSRFLRGHGRGGDGGPVGEALWAVADGAQKATADGMQVQQLCGASVRGVCQLRREACVVE